MVVSILSAAVGVLVATNVALLWLYLQARKSLQPFASIRDIDSHQAEIQKQCGLVRDQLNQLTNESQSLEAQIVGQKGKVAQYQKLLGNLKSAAELQQKIRDDKARAQQLATALGGLDRASQINEYLRKQQLEVAQRKLELEQFTEAIGSARTASEVAAQVTYYENYLAQLKADVEAVEETAQLQEFGFYRPQYNFESSDEFKKELARIRTLQKAMLKDRQACLCETEWTVDGDKRQGKKMVDQQIKLMLRAFNGECDAAVSKVKYNNAVSMKNRIKKSFDAINKLGETKKVNLARGYCELKFQELQLNHELQEKRQEEREEQQRIREQMKEEEKVLREIERAQEDAERDEAMKAQAL